MSKSEQTETQNSGAYKS